MEITKNKSGRSVEEGILNRLNHHVAEKLQPEDLEKSWRIQPDYVSGKTKDAYENDVRHGRDVAFCRGRMAGIVFLVEEFWPDCQVMIDEIPVEGTIDTKFHEVVKALMENRHQVTKKQIRLILCPTGAD